MGSTVQRCFWVISHHRQSIPSYMYTVALAVVIACINEKEPRYYFSHVKFFGYQLKISNKNTPICCIAGTHTGTLAWELITFISVPTIWARTWRDWPTTTSGRMQLDWSTQRTCPNRRSFPTRTSRSLHTQAGV